MVTRQNKWAAKRRAFFIELFGGCCQFVKENGEICGSTEKLEFAHINETGLNGRGRGLIARVLDLQNHPNDYELFCHECHVLHDKGKKVCEMTDDEFKEKVANFDSQNGGCLNGR